MRFFECFVIAYLMISITSALDDKRSKNKRIVIIGAGLSGISAASKLLEHGFQNITILEAENRIGGRLNTTKFGNYYVDLGGQWVHGEKNNVAFNLADPLDLVDTDHKASWDETLFDSKGNHLSEDINQYLTNFIDKYYIAIGVPDKSGSSNDSYGDYIGHVYDQEFANLTEMINLKDRFLHYLEILALSWDSADSWYDVSLQDTDGLVVLDGDQEVNWKSKGFAKILDVIMKRYPDPKRELPTRNDTILNAEVTLIDYSESENGHPIAVTTKDNRTFEADHVIVTVSLGVLKERHQSLFNPPLPAKKVEVIEHFGYGNAGKVFLLFDKPFWNLGDKKTMRFAFIWHDSDRKAIEADPEKMWVLGITGALPVEHKPNLLEFFIASKWSKAMEMLPENKVYNHTMELLERFLGKVYEIPEPVAMLRTRWYLNPHFNGAYSFRTVESEKRNIHPKMLQEPFTPENPTLLFAGEATSPHRYATADGAIASGWAAADTLINFYKNSTS